MSEEPIHLLSCALRCLSVRLLPEEGGLLSSTPGGSGVAWSRRCSWLPAPPRCSNDLPLLHVTFPHHCLQWILGSAAPLRHWQRGFLSCGAMSLSCAGTRLQTGPLASASCCRAFRNSWNIIFKANIRHPAHVPNRNPPLPKGPILLSYFLSIKISRSC